jgi:hypothetical protein
MYKAGNLVGELPDLDIGFEKLEYEVIARKEKTSGEFGYIEYEINSVEYDHNNEQVILNISPKQ